MTVNDLEWLFHVKIRFRPALRDSERLIFKNNKLREVTNIEPYYQRWKCSSMTSFWQYKLFLDIRQNLSDYCRQIGVWWLKSMNLQFSQCYIFVRFGNNVDIVVCYDNNPFLPTPIRMILNDLECPIHLKVRLAEGTPAERMLWLSEFTMRD